MPFFSATQIHVETVEAQSIGAGLRPVGIREDVEAGPRLRTSVEDKIAVVYEPGVEVEGSTKWSESVIGDDEHGGVCVRGLKCFAEHGVHLDVVILDDMAVFDSELRTGGRRFLVDGAPEHMARQIDAGEIVEEEARAEASQFMQEEVTLIFKHEMRLLEVLVVVEGAGGEGLGIFGDTLGVEGAHVADEFTRVVLRGGEGQRGIGRVDVDRRDVQLELRAGLLQVEAADAGNAFHAGNKSKSDADPRAPLAGCQNELLALDGETHYGLVGVPVDSERYGQLRVTPAKGIWRSVELRLDTIIRGLYRIDHAAAHGAGSESGIVRIERESAVASKEVGRAQAGEGLASLGNGREIVGHTENDDGNIPLVKVLPESLSVAQQLYLSLGYGDDPAADPQVVLGRLNLRTGEEGCERGGVAMDEIE